MTQTECIHFVDEIWQELEDEVVSDARCRLKLMGRHAMREVLDALWYDNLRVALEEEGGSANTQPVEDWFYDVKLALTLPPDLLAQLDLSQR